jgi:site-specific DNA recombinase
VEAEISGTQSAVERYYSAFENGRLSEGRFGSRVDALERRLTQLRAKLAELRDTAINVEAPSKDAIRSAEEAVRDAMLNGTPGQRKALLKELIVEVRVESRDSIIPTFRLPATPSSVQELHSSANTTRSSDAASSGSDLASMRRHQSACIERSPGSGPANSPLA